MSDYVCALSGVEADEAELVDGSDDLGDLPVGWTKITVQRRLLNPRWYEVQQAKGALVEVTLSQLPEEMREQMRPLITVQVDAQFAALEANIEEFVLDEDEVFVAPPESDKALAAEYFDIRDRLGLSNEGFGGEEETAEDGEEG
ncbi:MAG: hypothetical protein KGR69_11080 [Verrucomicrobia bacterium]|nr:hypothetical protein [Verrucomicrobiota bacterium]